MHSPYPLTIGVARLRSRRHRLIFVIQQAQSAWPCPAARGSWSEWRHRAESLRKAERREIARVNSPKCSVKVPYGTSNAGLLAFFLPPSVRQPILSLQSGHANDRALEVSVHNCIRLLSYRLQPGGSQDSRHRSCPRSKSPATRRMLSVCLAIIKCLLKSYLSGCSGARCAWVQIYGICSARCLGRSLVPHVGLNFLCTK